MGVYLYNNEYSEDVVLAGLLHDAIEWSGLAEEILRDEFGDKVLNIVLACTKDDTIKDKEEKIVELIKRCVEAGEDALIVKAADILDSYKWYTNQKNISEMEYCSRNAIAILKYKPDNYKDKIFDELRTW